MYNVDDLKSVWIGRRGEDHARVIEINVSSMLAQWPDAEISVILHRAGEDTPLLCSTTLVDGVLIWTVGAAETATAGEHPFEVRAINNGMLMKSKTGVAVVDRAVGDYVGEAAPAAVQTWIDALTEALASIPDVSFTDDGEGNIVVNL